MKVISIHIYGTDVTRTGSSVRRYYDLTRPACHWLEQGPAVDPEDVSGDEGRHRAQQVDAAGSDLVRLPEPAEERSGANVRFLLGRGRAERDGVDWARRDGVDADVVRARLARERLRQPDDGALRGGVVRAWSDASVLARGRREID